MKDVFSSFTYRSLLYAPALPLYFDCFLHILLIFFNLQLNSMILLLVFWLKAPTNHPREISSVVSLYGQHVPFLLSYPVSKIQPPNSSPEFSMLLYTLLL